jgi:putative inorganic carbon (hco3(-)) transporter
LLSTFCYVFLYYAFVSNLSLKHTFKLLKATLWGGVVTALWGFPSHFGYDPTCLVFRGNLDTTCWTEAFRPTVRIFSTIGQPAWLAAYLAALIPLALAYALSYVQKSTPKFSLYLGIAILFYVDLIFALTRAGFIAFMVANLVFWAIIYFKKFFTQKIFLRYLLLINGIFVVCNFLFGIPVFDKIRQFTLPEILTRNATQTQQAPVAILTPTPQAQPAAAAAPQPQQQAATPVDSGITDSGNIRQHVWKGAIDAWKANSLFGTGVETFAFAYYKFRPVGHNLTTEWDYLYNKAHNEYLNYLTTTGLFGLGTYLFFIGFFIYKVSRWALVKSQAPTSHDKHKKDEHLNDLLVIGLFAGWVSILISNFFGFSVVIVNLFLFLFPVLAFLLYDLLDPEKTWEFSWGTSHHDISPYQWTALVVLFLICSYFIIDLSRYWYADTKYALGTNLDHVGSYQDAYPLLMEAVKIKPNEPVYKDELAINMSVLATALAAQKDTTTANQFANDAIALNGEVVTAHPNNVVYWKNRVRLFYTLAQVSGADQQLIYYQEALKAIQKASEIAPTDAKIAYNLGVLYGQTGDIPKGIEVLEQTIKMKPNYRDPYYALGLFYYQLSLDQNNKVIRPELKEKAVAIFNYILTNLNPADEEVKKTLKTWDE